MPQPTRRIHLHLSHAVERPSGTGRPPCSPPLARLIMVAPAPAPAPASEDSDEKAERLRLDMVKCEADEDDGERCGR